MLILPTNPCVLGVCDCSFGKTKRNTRQGLCKGYLVYEDMEMYFSLVSVFCYYGFILF